MPAMVGILEKCSAEEPDLRSNQDELPGDVFLRNIANINNCSPIRAAVYVVASCRRSCNYLAETLDVNKMIDLTALSSMLSTSQIFRNMGSYTTTHEEFSAIKDLWELFTTLGLYYSGTDILKSYCEDNRYRPFLQHLVAKPANILSSLELASLNIKHGWPIKDNTDVESNVSTIGCQHHRPIEDFYDVLHLRRARLKKQGPEIPTAWREDWVRKLPTLADWNA